MTNEHSETDWEIVATALGRLTCDSARFDTRYDEVMADLECQVRELHQHLLGEAADAQVWDASPQANLNDAAYDRFYRTRARIAQALAIFTAQRGMDFVRAFRDVADFLRPAARTYHAGFWRREIDPSPTGVELEVGERAPGKGKARESVGECSFLNMRELFGLLGYPPRFAEFLLKYRFLADVHPPVNEHQRGCPYVYPGLRQGPLLDDLVRPAMGVLEEAFPEIREELLRCVKEGGFESLGTNWRAFQFYSFKTGQAISEHQEMFPRTIAAIKQVPGLNSKARNFVCLRRLPPGGRIQPHWGTTNVRVRIHMGLSGCKGARISVGDSVHSWEEGKCFALDDSFRHEAWNDGPQDRFVLVVDVHHPDLSPLELDALSKVPFASLFVGPGAPSVFVRTPLASEDSLSSVPGRIMLSPNDVVPR